MKPRRNRRKIPQEVQRYRSKSQREAAASLAYFRQMISTDSNNPSTNDSTRSDSVLTDLDSRLRRVSDG
jgi:hypothetical protein